MGRRRRGREVVDAGRDQGRERRNLEKGWNVTRPSYRMIGSIAVGEK